MSAPLAHQPPDWESFYAGFRQPGYVRGFEITSKLGGGMFGLVFKATKQSIGKDYAIKFLKVDDVEVRRAVLAELEQVQYFAQVDHPNLVSIEDRGEVDGIPYLVMAYAGAETLRDLLPGTADTREANLRLFLQACRGVAALHERSLVHFDLKPANVFLKGGVARVGDYGLGKLITHSRGSLSMGRGTPYYMAPEMLQRRGDHRSDVYSLGVMLYEVLTGELPFRGDTEWEVLRQHEKAEVVFPEHVPAARRAIVQRCMHKDPAQRYQSVHDLLAVIGRSHGAAGPVVESAAPIALAATVPPPTVPPPTAPVPTVDRAPPRPPAKANRGGVGVLVTTSVLVVAFGVLLQQRSQAEAATAVAVRREVEARFAAARAPEPVHTSGNGVRDEIHQLAAQIDQIARKRSAKVRLRALDKNRVAVPVDLPLYAQELEHLVAAECASPLTFAQLEALGYPIVLAAVAWLQEQDYRDDDSCTAAARVLALLRQTTAVAGFDVEAPSGSVDATSSRRFAAAADAWRRLVERHAGDAEAYRLLLLATGKVAEPRKN